jgi:site-specific recombinase XerC
LGQDLPWLKEIGHPRRHRRLPVVLTVDEVGRLLQGLTGEHLLLGGDRTFRAD